MNKKEEQTMKRILSIAAVACALMLGSSVARADNTGGLCNSIIGNVLGTAQQFVNGVGDPVQQCTDVGAALIEFEETPGCFDALLNGEVQGLTGPAVFYSHGQKAGQYKQAGSAICLAICGCGFFPLLPEGVCPGTPCP
jgi:hypothetical protein